MLKHSNTIVARSQSLGRSDAPNISWAKKGVSSHRPASYCDTHLYSSRPPIPGTHYWNTITNRHSIQNYSTYSINRIGSTDAHARLPRVPSQANNLSTTVPTRIVSAPLGERHVPTRQSLKHSRMVALSKKMHYPRRRPLVAACEMRRLWTLVLAAQIIVGGVGVGLALWVLLWVPALKFKEVPHYAGVPVFLSGVFGAVFLSRLTKQEDCLAQGVKSFVMTLCIISIVACSCVSVYASLHLIFLAPMTCTPVGSFSLQPLLKRPIQDHLPDWRHASTLPPKNLHSSKHKKDREPNKILDRFLEPDYVDYEGSGGDLLSMWVRNYQLGLVDDSSGDDVDPSTDESGSYRKRSIAGSSSFKDEWMDHSLEYNAIIPDSTSYNKKKFEVLLSSGKQPLAKTINSENLAVPEMINRYRAISRVRLHNHKGFEISKKENADTGINSNTIDPSLPRYLSGTTRRDSHSSLLDPSMMASQELSINDTKNYHLQVANVGSHNMPFSSTRTEKKITISPFEFTTQGSVGREDANSAYPQIQLAFENRYGRTKRSSNNSADLACHCESRHQNFVKSKIYPSLSCHEVRNILPILFVAIIVAMATGAILSVIIIYIICIVSSPISTKTKNETKQEAELKPFLVKNNNNTRIEIKDNLDNNQRRGCQ